MAEILAHPMLYAALLIVSTTTFIEIKWHLADGTPVSKISQTEIAGVLAGLEK